MLGLRCHQLMSLSFFSIANASLMQSIVRYASSWQPDDEGTCKRRSSGHGLSGSSSVAVPKTFHCDNEQLKPITASGAVGLVVSAGVDAIGHGGSGVRAGDVYLPWRGSAPAGVMHT